MGQKIKSFLYLIPIILIVSCKTNEVVEESLLVEPLVKYYQRSISDRNEDITKLVSFAPEKYKYLKYSVEKHNLNLSKLYELNNEEDYDELLKKLDDVEVNKYGFDKKILHELHKVIQTQNNIQVKLFLLKFHEELLIYEEKNSTSYDFRFSSLLGAIRVHPTKGILVDSILIEPLLSVTNDHVEYFFVLENGDTIQHVKGSGENSGFYTLRQDTIKGFIKYRMIDLMGYKTNEFELNFEYSDSQL